jgi:ABC-2 type transport system permease protein
MPVNSSLPGAAAGSVIHDLGYRSYDGPRLGRAAIVRALAWHSFRSAFGFGRSAKAKVIPVLVLVVISLPAIVNAFSVAQGQPRIVGYDTYRADLRILAMLVFVAVQAPELVSRDLRSRVLPLYFSRPLRPVDYPAAKYLAFTGACLVMVELPLILLYLGTIVSLHGGSAIWAETRALIPGLLIGLMWAVVMAAIGLVLASLSGRRAFATGAIGIFFFLTFILATILLNAESPGHDPTELAQPPIAVKVAGLFSPFTLFDGVRRWLGGTGNPQSLVPDPGSFGVVYAIVLLALLAACLLGLAARYRKAALQ